MIRKLETLALLLLFCAASLAHSGCKSKKDKMRECKRKCEKKLKLKAAQRFCKALCERKYGKKPRSEKQLVEDCKKGDGKACLRAANKFISTDKAKAAKYLQKGCDAKEYMACFYLAKAYNNGKGVPKDKDKASKYFSMACDGGYHKSCTNVGLRLITSNPTKALAMFKKGCEADSKYGCGMTGVMYRDGRGVPVDKAQAKKYFKKACSMGLKLGCQQAAKLP